MHVPHINMPVHAQLSILLFSRLLIIYRLYRCLYEHLNIAHLTSIRSSLIYDPGIVSFCRHARSATECRNSHYYRLLEHLPIRVNDNVYLKNVN